ncbi:MAG TPA: dihydrolipoamide acetyltransferase family protein [Gammaproteobacteria bacterium]|jgi:pyruvate dehydrogenase E2 component (dihydrolipoamide acetyltransferase)
MSGPVFTLPDLGEGLHEAEIVAWHVGVGDHVVADQPLLSVETDKAIVEVPSPQSGHVAALHGEPGDVVEVGAPLVEFVADATDHGAIVGDLETPGEAVEAEPEPPTPKRARAGVRAAPATRRLAEELGIDLGSLTGTGPEGAILPADVRAAAALQTSRAERLRGVRRTMFRNMQRAGREIVAATVTDEADVDAWPPQTDVTIRLIGAIAAATAAAPSLNAWLDAGTESRTLHEHVDLAIAVETDDGLFAPVLRNIAARDEASLREGLEQMKRDVAARSIPRDSMQRATLTLSNFGMYGGRFAGLVVTPPQVAILGAGRIAPRVVAFEEGTAVHQMLPLSLSFDHRVVTGVEATRFLTTLISELEKPYLTD